MKKMDEMERNIQLRSESLGYKAVLLALCAWTLWSSGQAWFNSGTYQPWPSILLGLAVCVQGFSQVALKHRMIAGDEEYHEPHRLLGMSITAFVIFVLILALGAAWLR